MISTSRYKIILFIYLIVFSCSGLISFGKQDTNRQLTIAYSVMDMSNPYFQTLVNGCRDRASQLGIEFIYKDAESSAEKQYDHVNEFINMGVDVIICSPFNSAILKPLVKKCKELNIPLINPNQKIEGADAHIIINEYDFGFSGGVIAGKFIRDNLNGYAEILLLTYPPEQVLLKKREKGMIEGIRQYSPDSVIVSKVSAHTPELGMAGADFALSQFEDIKVIVALNDAAAIGAFESVKTMNRDSDDFCIVGLDATDRAISKMKQPDSVYRGTVDIDPYGTGKLIIDTSLEVLENGPLKDIIYIPMRSITKENLYLF